MQTRSSTFRTITWIVLFTLISTLTPAVSRAQEQPTATISTFNGAVLVNGQAATTGVVLRSGDVVETQGGGSVVLTLSDGSQLDIGEQTRLDVSELTRTVSGARVSRVKLMWGWMRAKLSPDHQHEGSRFEIDTPNAVIGVKFSQPDVEVSYDPAKQETVAFAPSRSRIW